MINYNDLEMRYGSATAQYLVQEIEKAAKIASNENLTPQERLEAADRAVSL